MIFGKRTRKIKWTNQRLDAEKIFSGHQLGVGNGQIEKLYNESKLPYSPDENKIRELLLSCLEEHYGNLNNCIVREDKTREILRQIKELVEKSGL